MMTIKTLELMSPIFLTMTPKSTLRSLISAMYIVLDNECEKLSTCYLTNALQQEPDNTSVLHPM